MCHYISLFFSVNKMRLRNINANVHKGYLIKNANCDKFNAKLDKIDTKGCLWRTSAENSII